MLITCALPTCDAEPTVTVRMANHQTMMVCAHHSPVRVFFPDGSTAVTNTAAVLEALALSFDARASIDRDEDENISANAAAALRRRAAGL